MMKNGILLLPMLLVSFLFSCQTTPQPTPTPQPTATPTPSIGDKSSIQIGVQGFSPRADAPANYLTLQLHFALPNSVQSWKVEFVHSEKGTQRTLSDKAPQLPPSITWDGKDDSGKLAPEGSYQAMLTVDSTSEEKKEVVTSSSFVLDVTPPSASLEISPNPFSPENPDNRITLKVSMKDGGAKAIEWRLFVNDPKGSLFSSFVRADHQDNQVVWDGRAPNNALLESGTTYPVVVKVYDEFGNRGEIVGNIPVAIYAQKIDGQMVIKLSSIIFKAYSDDYTNIDPDQAKSNLKTLDELAAKLKEIASSTVLLVGHANKVFWQDENKGQQEQTEVLIPLSKERSEAIRKALEDRGVPASSLQVKAVGADDPVVPFSDMENNWKNRRVEFVFPNKGS